MGEVAALPVEHGHGHRGMGHDLPQLLALPLQRLLDQLAVGDVAGHGQEAAELLLLEGELDALAQPDLLPGGRHHRELAVGVGDALPPLVLVELPGLVLVVGAHAVTEIAAEELVRLEAEGFGHRGVQVVESALGVGAVDQVVDGLDQLSKTLLARPEARHRLALRPELRVPLVQGPPGLGGTALEQERPHEDGGGDHEKDGG